MKRTKLSLLAANFFLLGLCVGCGSQTPTAKYGEAAKAVADKIDGMKFAKPGAAAKSKLLLPAQKVTPKNTDDSTVYDYTVPTTENYGHPWANWNDWRLTNLFKIDEFVTNVKNLKNEAFEVCTHLNSWSNTRNTQFRLTYDQAVKDFGLELKWGSTAEPIYEKDMVIADEENKTHYRSTRYGAWDAGGEESTSYYTTEYVEGQYFDFIQATGHQGELENASRARMDMQSMEYVELERSSYGFSRAGYMKIDEKFPILAKDNDGPFMVFNQNKVSSMRAASTWAEFLIYDIQELKSFTSDRKIEEDTMFSAVCTLTLTNGKKVVGKEAPKGPQIEIEVIETDEGEEHYIGVLPFLVIPGGPEQVVAELKELGITLPYDVGAQYERAAQVRQIIEEKELSEVLGEEMDGRLALYSRKDISGAIARKTGTKFPMDAVIQYVPTTMEGEAKEVAFEEPTEDKQGRLDVSDIVLRLSDSKSVTNLKESVASLILYKPNSFAPIALASRQFDYVGEPLSLELKDFERTEDRVSLYPGDYRVVVGLSTVDTTWHDLSGQFSGFAIAPGCRFYTDESNHVHLEVKQLININNPFAQ